MLPVDGGHVDRFAGLSRVARSVQSAAVLHRPRSKSPTVSIRSSSTRAATRSASIWKQPFIRDGRELKWADGDGSVPRRRPDGRRRPRGKPGTFRRGRATIPVSGVSWFEAAAYAEFSGKSPAGAWRRGYKAAPVAFDRFVVAIEQSLGRTRVRVGQFEGLGPYGTSDLIGNVREWYWNASGGQPALHSRPPGEFLWARGAVAIRSLPAQRVSRACATPVPCRPPRWLPRPC